MNYLADAVRWIFTGFADVMLWGIAIVLGAMAVVYLLSSPKVMIGLALLFVLGLIYVSLSD